MITDFTEVHYSIKMKFNKVKNLTSHTYSSLHSGRALINTHLTVLRPF